MEKKELEDLKEEWVDNYKKVIILLILSLFLYILIFLNYYMVFLTFLKIHLLFT